MKLIQNLYQYRELLKSNIKKEIRGKYKGSFLGVIWSFINPLLQVLVYALVFPYLMDIKGTDNYLIYLVVGIIPWTFFTTVITQGVTSIRYNAGIVKKVYFPREILPISVAISGYVNFLISCIIVLIFVLIGGYGISWHILLVPIIGAIQMLFSLGLILALSAINIYVKDIEYIVTFIVNMLFYGTPILYKMNQFTGDVPGILVKLVEINPLTTFMNAYRDVFMYHVVPDMKMGLLIVVISILVFLIGLVIFRKLEKGFAEEI
ncbi:MULTISPECIES: ABC transporter permease [unclassified Breznakia]|uniref:ABC transporter permease n=1 Tax=unclassified Breznakia TaxID=2623764 RepID=UPI002476FD55|nr:MULTISPECIES: ABC transporter permease [unclassified Breznakia]MDH6367905.1 lipopolysaccharide transport system permease protein [Breznakia sp. PH1-1]MDH6404993.1 lipopolysaccharide transport system permease protein [Breznakia sp. PF1-11]MDH6412696.1 lipopolysaccharide transport system permease protein [Breznakia sp. PFB1-11]MDH6415068.1 lipopolysaccharide transport system permease protein [Breznakia sp. PFB1-14]MDH6417379.1 lipopolysaccharide transport system permease protein [Breznakia sp